MRLTIEVLEAQLRQKQLASCYFLVSSESFLLQEARDAIWQTATREGFSARQLWEIKPQFNWDQIKNKNNEFDLFHRSFIELRCAPSLDIKTGNQLNQFVESLQASSFSPLVVVSCENCPAKLKRTDWFQKLASKATFILIEQPSAYQLPYWLKKELDRNQLKLEKEAVFALVESVEGNLRAAKQTIKKLSLLYGANKEPLNKEQLCLILEDEVMFELSHLIDAILQGQPDRCMRIIKHLECMTPPALVLGYLLKTLRTASGLLDGLDRGQTISQLFEKYGVWQKQQAGFKKMMQFLTKEKIAQLFYISHHADRCIKGVYKEPSWRYLQQLSLLLSGAHMPFIKVL